MGWSYWRFIIGIQDNMDFDQFLQFTHRHICQGLIIIHEMCVVHLNPTSSNIDANRDTLPWRHNERDGVSKHQRLGCLLSSLFRQIKENFKTSRHWTLWGEFTGDQWIPLTKGQYRGKCFHSMTSSCEAFGVSVGQWVTLSLKKCKSTTPNPRVPAVNFRGPFY